MDFLRRTWAEIDTNALIHNFKIIKKTATTPVMAIVKADAYGHGADIVAPLLEAHGADFFGVSNIEEAIELRDYGITKPILILGYTPSNLVAELIKYDISQCVYCYEIAKELSAGAKSLDKTLKIHLKLDTGMSRLGFDCRNDSLEGINLALKSAQLENLYIEGIFTHFAVSDRTECDDDGFTDEQYNRFCKAVDYLKSNGVTAPFNHCCNSAAICQDANKHLAMCRAGIILYGLTPSADLTLQQDFIPVMEMKSVISMIKTIHTGDTVSYGRTFTADRDIKIATVTAGYADGYPRALSNKGYVLINGKPANIIGRVCMDQFCVDVTGLDVSVGDEVLLFGKDLPIENLAEICGTINYELVCGVSPRVKRIATGQ
ncbi:MAG: alanine racemase [Clostridia bacterium]|nr:alanine racemase [Clostridia bacterium]